MEPLLINYAAAAFAFLSGFFWYRSSKVPPPPPGEYTIAEALTPYFEQVSKNNKWAAIFAGVAVVLSSIPPLLA